MKKIKGKNNLSFFRLLTVTVQVFFIFGCAEAQSSNRTQSTTPEKSGDCSFPDPKGFVNDYANLISQPTAQDLEKRLSKLKENSEIEMAVVVIDTTGKESIDDYSLKLARCWGIGPKDEKLGGGVLLLVAKDDRKWRIQVSRSLEKDLTDDLVKEIGERMSAEFKLKRYDRGVKQAVNDLITNLEKMRNLKRANVHLFPERQKEKEYLARRILYKPLDGSV